MACMIPIVLSHLSMDFRHFVEQEIWTVALFVIFNLAFVYVDGSCSDANCECEDILRWFTCG